MTSFHLSYHMNDTISLCSIIFGDMNKHCSLGVIEKYLSFLCAIKVLPLPIMDLYQACPQVLHSIKSIISW